MKDILDLSTDDGKSRLKVMVERNRGVQKQYMTQYLESVSQYVGGNYSASASSRKVPITLLTDAVNIHKRLVVGNPPKAEVTSENPGLRLAAPPMQYLLNRRIKQLGLARTVRLAFMEAMFAPFGIIKTTMQKDADGRFSIACDHVRYENMVFDMTACLEEGLQVIGDLFEVPRDEAVKRWGEEKVKHVQLAVEANLRQGGQRRAKELGGGDKISDQELKKSIGVWSLFLHTEKGPQIVNVPYGVENEILERKDWQGPPTGPYQLLGFHEVPGNLMPLPPTSLWFDLHYLANIIFRKLARQAERQKTVAVGDTNNADSARELKNASDGDFITARNLNVEEVRTGGVNPEGFALFLQMRRLFSTMAGNIDILGGLGSQADTLGQEQLMAGQAGTGIADMARTTYEFVGRVLYDVGYLMLMDPWLNEQVTIRVPNTSLYYTDRIVADSFFGAWTNFDVCVVPGSMMYLSPAAKAQMLMSNVDRLAPILPILTEQGYVLDGGKLVELLARWQQLPELADVLKKASAPSQPMAGPTERPRQAAVTRREYNRINTPGVTPAQQEQTMIQKLLGSAGMQESQMAAVE
jgi:hypothetical protein